MSHNGIEPNTSWLQSELIDAFTASMVLDTAHKNKKDKMTMGGIFLIIARIGQGWSFSVVHILTWRKLFMKVKFWCSSYHFW